MLPRRFIAINGVLCETLPLEAADKTSAAERRRQRNRDAMRQARRRRQEGVDTLKALVQSLEEQLRRLTVENGPVEGNSNNAAMQEMKAAAERVMTMSRRRRMRSLQLMDDADQLRDENLWLSHQIREFAKFSSQLRELLGRCAVPAVDFVDLDGYNIIEHALLSQYQLLSPLEIFDLVKESYDSIMGYARLADACRASSHTALGWSDKRRLEGTWASFMVSKTFMHEMAEDLADKTWATSTDFSRYRQVQRWAQRMKILQVLNKETLIVTRENVYPEDGSTFHTFYLLFRATVLTGYIIGTRSLNLQEVGGVGKGLMAEQQQGHERKFTNALYCFIFTRVSAAPTGSQHSSQPPPGCMVQLGGRIGNGNVEYARTVLLDVLPTTLRWENLCVRPIMSLTSD